jgi:hypothetical protein
METENLEVLLIKIYSEWVIIGVQLWVVFLEIPLGNKKKTKLIFFNTFFFIKYILIL